MRLLHVSWAPALALAVGAGGAALLCGAIAANILPSAVAYALLVLP